MALYILKDLISYREYKEFEYPEKQYNELDLMVKALGFTGLHCRKPVNNKEIEKHIKEISFKNGLSPVSFTTIMKRISSKLRRNNGMTVNTDSTKSQIVWDTKKYTYYIDDMPKRTGKNKTLFFIRECINHNCDNTDICENMDELTDEELKLDQEETTSEKKDTDIDMEFIPQHIRDEIKKEQERIRKQDMRDKILEKRLTTNCTECDYCTKLVSYTGVYKK